MTKLIYEKGKPMKEEGIIPSIKEKARSAINFTINLGGKVMDKVEGKMKEMDNHKKEQYEKMQEENSGREVFKSKEPLQKIGKKVEEPKMFTRKSLTPLKKMNKRPAGRI
jgi:activator of 2-hydroxyglutaryl-CoA dehydratase